MVERVQSYAEVNRNGKTVVVTRPWLPTTERRPLHTSPASVQFDLSGRNPLEDFERVLHSALLRLAARQKILDIDNYVLAFDQSLGGNQAHAQAHLRGGETDEGYLEALTKTISARAAFPSTENEIRTYLSFPLRTPQAIEARRGHVRAILKCGPDRLRDHLRRIGSRPRIRREMDATSWCQFLRQLVEVRAACDLYFCGPLRDTVAPLAPLFRILHDALDLEKGQFRGEKDTYEPERRAGVYARQFGFPVSVKKSKEGLLVFETTRSHLSKIQYVKKCLKTRIVFTTPALECLNRDFYHPLCLEIAEERKEAERALLAQITKTYPDGPNLQVETLWKALSRLDIYCCFARQKGVWAEYASEGQIHCVNLGTPVLSGGGVRNDVKLDAGTTTFITGVNTHGKSTFLRAVYTAVLLNQVGCRVPCSFARMGLFDQVHLLMGEKKKRRSESTFMAHARGLAEMEEGGGQSQLRVIDEICTATNTKEGIALAKKVLGGAGTHSGAQGTHSIGWGTGPLTLVSTHYNEMVRELVELPSHSSICLDKFKSRPGICDGSIALEICEKMGMDVRDARWYLKK